MRKLASVVMVLAACGDDGPVRHLDGGPTDSPEQMIDGMTPQAVTLTVTSNGTPTPGVKVYFQGVDSSLISNTTTDATGVATALMPSGGFVTAVDPYGVPGGVQTEFHDLYTFSGVKAGDHLVLKDSFSSSTEVTITAPVDGTAGVTGYLFSTPCDREVTVADGSGAQPSVSLFLDAACATTTDFLVASLDDAGQVVNWFYVPNRAVAATVDLTGSTYGAPTVKTYAFTNAPNEFGSVQFAQQFVSTKGTVVMLQSQAFGKGSPYTGSLPTTPFPGAVDLVQGSASTGSNVMHGFVDWGPFAATYSTDVGARMLPEFDVSSIDTTAHALVWTETAAGVTPDFVLSFLSASRERQASNLAWSWSIVAPYSGASVAFPTLPTDIADFAIAPGDGVDLDGVVLGKVPGGYDALRANVFNVDGPESLVTSATGSITLAQWSAPRIQPETRVQPRRIRASGFVTGIMREPPARAHRRN